MELFPKLKEIQPPTTSPNPNVCLNCRNSVSLLSLINSTPASIQHSTTFSAKCYEGLCYIFGLQQTDPGAISIKLLGLNQMTFCVPCSRILGALFGLQEKFRQATNPYSYLQTVIETKKFGQQVSIEGIAKGLTKTENTDAFSTNKSYQQKKSSNNIVQPVHVVIDDDLEIVGQTQMPTTTTPSPEPILSALLKNNIPIRRLSNSTSSIQSQQPSEPREKSHVGLIRQVQSALLSTPREVSSKPPTPYCPYTTLSEMNLAVSRQQSSSAKSATERSNETILSVEEKINEPSSSKIRRLSSVKMPSYGIDNRLELEGNQCGLPNCKPNPVQEDNSTNFSLDLDSESAIEELELELISSEDEILSLESNPNLKKKRKSAKTHRSKNKLQIATNLKSTSLSLGLGRLEPVSDEVTGTKDVEIQRGKLGIGTHNKTDSKGDEQAGLKIRPGGDQLDMVSSDEENVTVPTVASDSTLRNMSKAINAESNKSVSDQPNRFDAVSSDEELSEKSGPAISKSTSKIGCNDPLAAEYVQVSERISTEVEETSPSTKSTTEETTLADDIIETPKISIRTDLFENSPEKDQVLSHQTVPTPRFSQNPSVRTLLFPQKPYNLVRTPRFPQNPPLVRPPLLFPQTSHVRSSLFPQRAFVVRASIFSQTPTVGIPLFPENPSLIRTSVYTPSPTARVPITPVVIRTPAIASASGLIRPPISVQTHTLTRAPISTSTPVVVRAPFSPQTTAVTWTPIPVAVRGLLNAPTTVAVGTPLGAPTSVAVRTPLNAHAPVAVGTPRAALTSVAVRTPLNAPTPVAVGTPRAALTSVAVRTPLNAHAPVAVGTPRAALTSVAVRTPLNAHTPIAVGTPLGAPTSVAVRTPLNAPVAVGTLRSAPSLVATVAVRTSLNAPTPVAVQTLPGASALINSAVNTNTTIIIIPKEMSLLRTIAGSLLNNLQQKFVDMRAFLLSLQTKTKEMSSATCIDVGSMQMEVITITKNITDISKLIYIILDETMIKIQLVKPIELQNSTTTITTITSIPVDVLAKYFKILIQADDRLKQTEFETFWVVLEVLKYKMKRLIRHFVSLKDPQQGISEPYFNNICRCLKGESTSESADWSIGKAVKLWDEIRTFNDPINALIVTMDHLDQGVEGFQTQFTRIYDVVNKRRQQTSSILIEKK